MLIPNKITTGGKLCVKTENIKIFDQEKQEISLNKLTEVSYQYWNKL